MVWRDDEILLSGTNLDAIEAFFTVDDIEGAARPTVRTEK
jgi:hypothetical protein